MNPCGSWHHPAVKAGLCPAETEKSVQEAYTPTSTCFGCGAVYNSCSAVQTWGLLRPSFREFYVLVFCPFETLECTCTVTAVCRAQYSSQYSVFSPIVYAGPAAGDHGLHLRSFRSNEGLEAIMEFNDKFNCFPNVVNGGAISTALDCHGNWCAALTLMDEACLPWPPLTVTYSIGLTYRQPTPPNTRLILAAQVSLFILYEAQTVCDVICRLSLSSMPGRCTGAMNTSPALMTTQNRFPIISTNNSEVHVHVQAHS